MIRTQLFACSVLLAGMAAAVDAQTMTVRPKSDVVLSGRSNVNSWACRSEVFEATISKKAPIAYVLNVDDAGITRISVTVPVKSLRCSNGRMEQDLYQTLAAARFPTIDYALVSYEVDTTCITPIHFKTMTVGDITVAGVTRRVAIPISADRQADGSVIGTGSLKLRMTDFGVKPPVALLGLIRARNDIEVSFEVLLDTPIVAALTRK